MPASCSDPGDQRTGDLLDLGAQLDPVLGTAAVDRPAVGGPRWWWSGRLDVEGLALGSVGAVLRALGAHSAGGPTRTFSTSSAAVAAWFGSVGHLRIDGRAPQVWAPMSGFHRTSDGWIRVHANYPHHAARLQESVGVDSLDGLRAALAERTSAEAEAAITDAGGVAAAVEESCPSAAGSRAPWIRFTTTDCAAARPHPPVAGPRLPLTGVRVLDLTRVLAGPTAGRLLATLGADVLRVDPPHLPELTEAHVDTGFSKRSAVADLRLAEEMARVRSLVADADVVIQGYRPGAVAPFGLDTRSLRAEHPHLAVVSISSWEEGGPREGRRGFDSIVQAASGISHLYRGETTDGWIPGALPVQALDYATGLGAAAAAIALVAVRRSGRAGAAHLCLQTTAHWLLDAAPPPSAEALELDVELDHCESGYGRLDFVPPPLLVDGRSLRSSPPVTYGTSPLEWMANAWTDQWRTST